MIPILFLAVGLLLIYLEFFVPGAILGSAGGLLVLSSIFFAVITYEGLAWILLFVAAALFLVVAIIRLALWQIPRQKSGSGIYSAGDQQGYQASSYDRTAIGKVGTVLSDLRPGGYILIEGVQHQALSESGYVTKGSKVRVLRGEGDSLIVKEDQS